MLGGNFVTGYNAEPNDLIQGEVVRVYALGGVKKVVRAQGNSAPNLQGLLGVVASGVVGPGGPVAVATAAALRILLDVGLTPNEGDTLCVSTLVAGRASTVAGRTVATVFDASKYALDGSVVGVLAPGSSSGATGATGVGATGATGTGATGATGVGATGAIGPEAPRLANLAALAAIPTVAFSSTESYSAQVLSVDDFWNFDPTIVVLAYSNDTSYTVDALVYFGGVTYICVAVSTGNAPPNLAFWAKSMERIGSSDGLGSWRRLFVASLRSQQVSSWIVDPINGDDEGLTTTQTRSEIARRISGSNMVVRVTIPYKGVAITINSSLNVGDKKIPAWISESVPAGSFGLVVNYTGVPTALFTGAITGYTVRNGSAAQPTLMTIASLPVSWTASGLLNKIIEWTDGAGHFVRAVVVADMGAKTAWISPPVAQNFAFGAAFSVGQTINVWSLPSLRGGETVAGPQASSYTYLSAPLWICSVNDVGFNQLNCDGPIEQLSGVTFRTNCCNTSSSAGAINANNVVMNGQLEVWGGLERIIAAGGYCRINGPITATGPCGITVEGVGLVTNGSPIAQAADVEYTGGPIALACPAQGPNGLGGGKIILCGYVYGTLSSGSTVITAGSRNGFVSLAKIPNFGAAAGIDFSIAGIIGNLADLAFTDLADDQGNVVQGPNGAVLSGSNAAVNASGGILPSLRIVRSTGTSGQVTTAQDDTGPHAANLLGVSIVSSANAAKMMFAPAGIVPIQFDGAITLGKAYLSATATDGKASSTISTTVIGTVLTDLGSNIGLVRLALPA